MGVIGRHKIFEPDAVNSAKIAADTIIAADIDETVAYNFSAVTSTLAGILSGTVSGAIQPVGIDFRATTSTVAGVLANARFKAFAVYNVDTTSTARSWDGFVGSNFNSATIIASADYLGATTGSSGPYITATNTSSFTLFAPVASTVYVVAYAP